ncbi:hypothetical protein [Planktotalea sp.]|uniref:hypothetical protein n=1 Tax=Planktotalea sp. TaxID=2029877 RepID=UPI003F6B9A0D
MPITIPATGETHTATSGEIFSIEAGTIGRVLFTEPQNRQLVDGEKTNDHSAQGRVHFVEGKY